MCWLYVPEQPDWSLESVSRCHPPELFATSSGTVSRRPYSWRGWLKRPWIKLLSGTTLPPSTAAHGVALWISSLVGSRVSRGATPASAKAPTTNDGSGQASSACYARFNPDGSLSRTSTDLFLEEDSDPSSLIFTRSGSMRNGVCSVQPRLALRISASASSSWATATAHDRTHTPRQVDHGKQLANQVAAWGTPRVTTNGGIPSPAVTGKGSRLEDQAGDWPTPQTSDANGMREADGKRSTGLNTHAQDWPTPTATPTATPYGSSQNGINGVGGEHERPSAGTPSLENQAKEWPTPGANDWKGSTEPGQRRGQLDEMVAHQWPTPTANDSFGGGSRNAENTKAHAGVSLTDKVLTGDSAGRGSDRSSPPVPAISSCGPECSPSHRRLNPRFVEWLMGWPDNWTSVSTGSGLSATESSLYRQQQRSVLSQLAQAGS